MLTYSFIIPVKPSGFVSAIDSLRELAAEPESFEILVAEGNSPSTQRNQAAQTATGDILYFLDDDSHIAPLNLQTCNSIMADPSVAVVGGPSLAHDTDTRIQKLFHYALTSPFGSGGVRNRYRSIGQSREATERELILCNLAVRRTVFIEAGGLDRRLYPNEENHLLDRIHHDGWKMMHHPAMFVRRSQRRNIRLFIRQMFAYGRGRAQQTMIAGPGPITSYIPLMFLIYLALVPCVGFSVIFCAPALAYAALALLFCIYGIATERSALAIFLLPLFPVMHITNGLGLAWGFMCGKPSTSSRTTEVVIKRLKNFNQPTW